jgi:hypothetical protein
MLILRYNLKILKENENSIDNDLNNDFEEENETDKRFGIAKCCCSLCKQFSCSMLKLIVPYPFNIVFKCCSQ